MVLGKEITHTLRLRFHFVYSRINPNLFTTDKETTTQKGSLLVEPAAAWEAYMPPLFSFPVECCVHPFLPLRCFYRLTRVIGMIHTRIRVRKVTWMSPAVRALNKQGLWWNSFKQCCCFVVKRKQFAFTETGLRPTSSGSRSHAGSRLLS